MEDIPKFQVQTKYDRRMLIIIGGILAFTAVIGLLFLLVDFAGALFLFGTTLFLALLFWIIVPRQYLIYHDRIVIRLGRPFSFGIGLENIRAVKLTKFDDTIAYTGLKFVTAFSDGVEIIRYKGWNMVITPEEPEMFLQQLEEALRILQVETNRV